MPKRPISPTSDETFQVSPADQQRQDAADEGVRQRREDQRRLGGGAEREVEQHEHAEERRGNRQRQSARVARAWLSTRPPTSKK